MPTSKDLPYTRCLLCFEWKSSISAYDRRQNRTLTLTQGELTAGISQICEFRCAKIPERISNHSDGESQKQKCPNRDHQQASERTNTVTNKPTISERWSLPGKIMIKPKRKGRTGTQKTQKHRREGKADFIESWSFETKPNNRNLRRKFRHCHSTETNTWKQAKGQAKHAHTHTHQQPPHYQLSTKRHRQRTAYKTNAIHQYNRNQSSNAHPKFNLIIFGGHESLLERTSLETKTKEGHCCCGSTQLQTTTSPCTCWRHHMNSRKTSTSQEIIALTLPCASERS